MYQEGEYQHAVHVGGQGLAIKVIVKWSISNGGELGAHCLSRMALGV
jgi:hypothetical protein